MAAAFSIPDLGPAAASLASCLAICLNANAIGTTLRVMDHPDGERKHHARVTPQVGGVAIMLGFVAWSVVTAATGTAQLHDLFMTMPLCAAGAALIGFTDDQTSTTAMSRLLLLTVFLALVFVALPSLSTNVILWQYLAPQPISPWLYYPLATVATIGLVNSANMADGQNGIVLGLFAIWSACLVLVGGHTVSSMAEILAVLCLVTLPFNLSGKLFMGDCGAYGVSFLIAMLTILAHARGQVCVATIVVWFFIPVIDCLRLIIVRLWNGNSPMEPDREHFHHRLRAGFGEKGALAIYLGAVAASSFLASLAPAYSGICLLVLTGFYFGMGWLGEASEARMAWLADVAGEQADGNLPSNVRPFPANSDLRERLEGVSGT
jgi:UDP-GlcNAc:undecaprenyl-phosphate GlcNAc-1-phosphate transferase